MSAGADQWIRFEYHLWEAVHGYLGLYDAIESSD